MSTITATSQMPSAAGREASKPSRWDGGLRINGHAVIFALATALALATAGECHSITNPPSLLYGGVLWLWWGGVASVIWRIGKHIPLASNFSLKAIFIHLAVASVLGVTHLLLLWSTGFVHADFREHGQAEQLWSALLNINRYGLEVLLYGFVFGIAAVIQFQIKTQRDAMKSLELQKELSAAHLRALQMQLEPHFLFNTLNAITTLVELGRQKEAAEMLSHLNAILKTTLKRAATEKVPLAQELENVENYLAIEQIRFADRLRIEIKVEPGVLDCMVPCFLLQPIVENAIRHGIAHCENAGVVEASARRDGTTLHLRVRDTGGAAGVKSQNGHGIGLKNTRERLEHFYQGAYAMQAGPLDAGGFEVAIRIPFEAR